uniref:Uncharacterized protein n=1 Tax=Noctiluca scintillans TaxID=2966 RepID=A0A7S1AM78_NOCSC|mmetsp:Transcript_51265/g.136829  ORF Transcript_51265/g.136829 Transcript_51265/m.136829 type:complete len:114 (+) Transcript_51265:209-550(+)
METCPTKAPDLRGRVSMVVSLSHLVFGGKSDTPAMTNQPPGCLSGHMLCLIACCFDPHILQWVNLIWNFGDTRMRIAPPWLSISGNEFMRNAELLLRRAKSLGFFALERTFRF